MYAKNYDQITTVPEIWHMRIDGKMNGQMEKNTEVGDPPKKPTYIAQL